MSTLPIKPNLLGAGYPVRLPFFEGPLDLLLHLIEREEMDINEISLVAVTDSYLKAIEDLEEIEPGALADFLVVAAKLLYIKSRTLLPKPRPPEEEEEEGSDSLIQQLLEYRRYKSVAEGLHLRQEAGLRAFVRLAPTPKVERKLDLTDVSLDKLTRALQRALKRIPSDPPRPRVHTYPITIAEQIEVVRERVRAAEDGAKKTIHFSTLLSEQRSRMEIVITFLAILELIKQREIVVVQEEIFGEIVLRRTEDGGRRTIDER
jgi:segregation and condensation protein A